LYRPQSGLAQGARLRWSVEKSTLAAWAREHGIPVVSLCQCPKVVFWRCAHLGGEDAGWQAGRLKMLRPARSLGSMPSLPAERCAEPGIALL